MTHSGLMAWAPAVSLNTRTRAITLTTMSTPNWIAMSTFCTRSLTTIPRADSSVMAMMKKHPRPTVAGTLSARESSPRNAYR